MRSRVVTRLLTAPLLFAVGWLALPPVGHAAPVEVLTARGVVCPAMADYVRRGIAKGEADGVACVVIRLNTPGGLMTSTREIVEAILAAEVPVAVYVSPNGAQAASAGAFIVLAAHVAAMAPTTNIGASTPVLMGGGGNEVPDQIDTLLKKSTNDAAAFIRALAERHGRNAEWAEQAVREAISASATEAEHKRVIDFVAADLDDLLAKMDGRRVELHGGKVVVLQTRGMTTSDIPMTARESFLMVISRPDIAYILLLVGVYCIIFELKSPGFGASAVLGVLCLILGLYALSALPVNFAGAALILLGIAFFIAELQIASHGILTAGGIICLALGSFMLIDTPGLRISTPVILTSVGASTGFFVFALGAVVAAHRRRPTTGTESLAGEHGIAKTDLAPSGQILCQGARWQATVEGESIAEGEEVEVIRIDGLELTVRRISAENSKGES